MMEDADLLPWTRTASGLVVLAHLAPADRDPVLAQAPVDPARLDAIRTAGLTTAEGTFETDVIGTAAPLFGADGVCTGAVAVAAAPTSRATPAARANIAAQVRHGGRRHHHTLGRARPKGRVMKDSNYLKANNARSLWHPMTAPADSLKNPPRDHHPRRGGA